MPHLFKSRGIQIHPRDTSLIFNQIMTVTLLCFGVALWFNYYPLWQSITWQNLNWPAIKSLAWTWDGLIRSLLFSLLLFFTSYQLLKRCFPNYLQSLKHRQKIARMFVENHWYVGIPNTHAGFFKDLASAKQERITRFPRIYYQRQAGQIHLKVEIHVGTYQDHLLHLEKRLETGLFCELVAKELHDSFIEYIMLYDTIANRITINEVKCQAGGIQLMKNVWWKYDQLPHMLIAGGTGGGKTYFLLTLIKALSNTNAKLTILDPKNADLADLESILPEVYHERSTMIEALNHFYEAMIKRAETMKSLPGYQTGYNYAKLGLPAHFLIFDEYVAFMDVIERDAPMVMSKLKQIVMIGRQAGFFLILACQRPDARYLGDGIRDQFMFRVTLGRMSRMGYNMMFGETDKDYFTKSVKGRGYVDVGNNVVSEFYAPFVPKGYRFLKQIKARSN